MNSELSVWMCHHWCLERNSPLDRLTHHRQHGASNKERVGAGWWQQNKERTWNKPSLDCGASRSHHPGQHSPVFCRCGVMAVSDVTGCVTLQRHFSAMGRCSVKAGWLNQVCCCKLRPLYKSPVFGANDSLPTDSHYTTMMVLSQKQRQKSHFFEGCP